MMKHSVQEDMNRAQTEKFDCYNNQNSVRSPRVSSLNLLRNTTSDNSLMRA